MHRGVFQAQKDKSRVLQEKVLQRWLSGKGASEKVLSRRTEHISIFERLPFVLSWRAGTTGRHSLYSGVESSVGHLNRMVREEDGEMSTDLRLEGGRTVFGEGLVRGKWKRWKTSSSKWCGPLDIWIWSSGQNLDQGHPPWPRRIRRNDKGQRF